MATCAYLTIPETAKRLGVSPNTIASWCWRGLLQRTKAGARTLISEAEIERFLAASTKKGAKLRDERRAQKAAAA
jgi:excisionase family DNA binding protein